MGVVLWDMIRCKACSSSASNQPKQAQQKVCPHRSILGSLALGGLLNTSQHIEQSSCMLVISLGAFECVPRCRAGQAAGNDLSRESEVAR